ncbi:MAG: arsenic resistance N-acetyltransferase ArsN2 [Halolamina sp.]
MPGPPTAPTLTTDLDAVRELLVHAGLPTAGVGDDEGDGDHQKDADYWLVRDEADDAVGCVGLERYDDAGLLRSLAVVDARRGEGLGTDLVGAVERAAANDGLTRLFLLTTDATGFFAALGYDRVARDDAPAAVRASVEFAEACPTSATAMCKRLD